MKAIFGGVIAFVLLGLYAASVTKAIILVMSHVPDPKAFTEGYQLCMTTIGALVSALVISVLAATDAGDVPLTRAMTDGNYTPKAINAAQYAMIAYLTVWIVCGLASFVFGVMMYPDGLPSLNSHGKAWIGLAVATGYAYFGLKQA